jgi:hypothetical protein
VLFKRVVLVFEVFLIFFIVVDYVVLLCRAFLYKNFLTDEECDHLIELVSFFSDYYWFWILFIVSVCVSVRLLCEVINSIYCSIYHVPY